MSAHEPDALVYCGPKLPRDAIEVPNPIIVVEVASPSTRKIDASLKLSGYFSLPSVQHYLIVDPDGPPLVHHRRQGDGTILTTIVQDGALTPPPLDPLAADRKHDQPFHLHLFDAAQRPHPIAIEYEVLHLHIRLAPAVEVIEQLYLP